MSELPEEFERLFDPMAVEVREALASALDSYLKRKAGSDAESLIPVVVAFQARCYQAGYKDAEAKAPTAAHWNALLKESTNEVLAAVDPLIGALRTHIAQDREQIEAHQEHLRALRVQLAAAEERESALREMVFTCPSCGYPAAQTKERTIDVHAGASYTCDECGQPVHFMAMSRGEYLALPAPEPNHLETLTPISDGDADVRCSVCGAEPGSCCTVQDPRDPKLAVELGSQVHTFRAITAALRDATGVAPSPHR